MTINDLKKIRMRSKFRMRPKFRIVNKNKKITGTSYLKDFHFITGVASIYDIYNAQRIHIDLSSSDDFNIIGKDFKDTGVDLKKAIEQYSMKNNTDVKKLSHTY